MTSIGAGGGAMFVPERSDLDVESAALLSRLESVRGAGSTALAGFDRTANVERAVDDALADGRVTAAEVEALVREAKDFGRITPGEKAVLADLVARAPELFDRPALLALAAFLDVAIPVFERPVPPSGGHAEVRSPGSGSAGATAAATSTSASTAALPTLRMGARGPDVIELQKAINGWRATRGLGAIGQDGDFGPGTLRAVQAFQAAHGLGNDGVVGPRTWAALAPFMGPPVEPAPRAAETFAARAAGATNAATSRIATAWQEVPGETSVSLMPGNGNRPVVVHLPPGFDPSKPAKVVTFFHGHNWNVGSKLDQHGVLDRVKELQARDPQTVFVMPESGRTPFSYWMNKASGESFKSLHDQAIGVAAGLSGASSLTIDRRVVNAHSGSGLTVVNAINSGELVADKVNLLDSAYSDWAQATARWAAAQPHRPEIESFYTWHQSQHANSVAAQGIAPGQVKIHAVGSGSLHNEVPKRHLDG